MLRFIIVDDESSELEKIRCLVNLYCIENNISNASIECFSSSVSFLEAFEGGARADIYILDIVMPNTDGLEVGARIKQAEKSANIIYLSTSSEYGVASYDVRALDYILKPCNKERFFQTLNRVSASKIEEKTLHFLVKMADGIYSLPQSDILYVEYYDHRLIVHTIDGKRIESVSQREPFMSLVEQLLREKNFLRISVSFVINMKYVRKLRVNEFEMIGGKKLPISRTCLECRGAYMNYVLNNN